MKLAIFSDIHGNFDAFQQVLKDIEDRGAERLICLGDCVGYGPEPEQVLAEIRRRRIETILGNHEAALLDAKQLNWFNPMAAESLRRTRQMLTKKSMRQIRDLPRTLVNEGARCVHGYPPDSVRTYLFRKSIRDLAGTLASLAEALCFVGHTHELQIVDFDGRKVDRRDLGQGVMQLKPDHRYLINIGSVGQPRDGNNNAKYILWDSGAGTIDLRFVPYDIATVVEKIKDAGLPETHGRRLW